MGEGCVWVRREEKEGDRKAERTTSDLWIGQNRKTKPVLNVRVIILIVWPLQAHVMSLNLPLKPAYGISWLLL